MNDTYGAQQAAYDFIFGIIQMVFAGPFWAFAIAPVALALVLQFFNWIFSVGTGTSAGELAEEYEETRTRIERLGEYDRSTRRRR